MKIDTDHIKLERRLGKGTFGEVYEYHTHKGTDLWAVKALLAKGLKQIKGAIGEIVAGRACDHQYILPVKDYAIEYNENLDEYRFWMKLPRMKGDLKQKIEEYQKMEKYLPENVIAKWLYNITDALLYLQQKQRIGHRDIKPANILLDSQNNVKLSDVGVAKFVSEGETSYTATFAAGTNLYMAPEILKQKEGSQIKNKELYAADLWSLGMTFAHLCRVKVPIKKENHEMEGKEIETKMNQSLQLLKAEGHYKGTLVDILCALIKDKPQERLSLEHVRQILEVAYPNAINSREPIVLESFNLNGKVKEPLKMQDQKTDERSEYSTDSQKEEISERTLSFEYTFKCMYSKQEGFSELLGTLEKSIHQLKNLKLDFTGANLSENNVLQLFSLIKDSGNNLQSLSLDFAYCKQLSSQSVEQIRDIICKKLPLRELHLGFDGCKKITFASIDNLVERLTNTFIGLKLTLRIDKISYSSGKERLKKNYLKNMGIILSD